MYRELLLYTQDLQAAKQEVESLGGMVVHRFTDVVFVANLPQLVDPLTLIKSSSMAPPGLDEVSEMAAKGWLGVGSTPGLVAQDPERGLAWDAPGRKPPLKISKKLPSLAPDVLRSTNTPTSLYMSGSIAVGIVIVSGPSASVSFDTRTPVTAVARRADHIDLFGVGADIPADGTTGTYRVYTTWRADSELFWHDWQTIGGQTFPVNTPVAAIARKSDQIDLFAVGDDGRVYTNWWNGSWHKWQAIGSQIIPTKTPIAAVARTPDQIDLFAVGDDGAGGTTVYTAWWDGSWHECQKLGNTGNIFPLLTPIAALARHSEQIDLFALATDKHVYTTWWNGSWQAWRAVGTQTFAKDTPITAIARTSDHIDLFALATNLRVHTSWWDGSWHEWQAIASQTFPGKTPIAAVVHKPDHIDLFAVGTAKNGGTTIYTNFWNGSWQAWEEVSDTNNNFSLLTPIAAVASHSEQIDLFGVKFNGTRDIGGINKDIFSVYTTWWHDSWHAWAPIGGELRFSKTEHRKVIGEVQQGLNFLISAKPEADISFVYDFQFVEVNAIPGDISGYEPAEAPWRNAALQQMGFDASRQGSMDYVKQLRQNKGTDWAYVGYLTKYQLHHFGYAEDEKICMEYANDGHGPDRINRVFAHETCHIFGAEDEYSNETTQCECGGQHGYLSVPNNNCLNCGGTHDPCLMTHNDLILCRWSQGQIGWGDPLLGFKPNTPVTSLSRKPDHIDLFVVGADGAVYANWWSNNNWHEWGQVGNSSGLFPAITPIAAIARKAEHIDLFAVGSDGRAYANWWDGAWHDWGTVGEQIFAPNTPVTSLARKADHIDLFVVGADGAVYANWWSDNNWHEWGLLSHRAPTFKLTTTQLPEIEGTEGQIPKVSALALGQEFIYATHYYTPALFQPSLQPGELVALERLTLAPVKRVTVGKSPRSIGLHQASHRLYVVNYQQFPERDKTQ